MAIWWLCEALPIHWTACVPLVVYPFSDVFSSGPLENAQRVVEPYFDAYIFLFLGGMCIAAAMQQWNLHRRVALLIMRAIGTDPRRLLFGFLAATAFISLWISNTATATMMLPDRPLGDRAAGGPRGRPSPRALSAPRSCWRSPTRRTSAASGPRSARRRTRSSRASWRSAASRSPSSSSWRSASPSSSCSSRSSGSRSGGRAGATPPRPRRGATCCARRSRSWDACAATNGWCWASSSRPQPSGSPAARSRISSRRASTLVELSSAHVEAAIAMIAALVLMLVRIAAGRARASAPSAPALRDAAAARREPRDGGGDRGQRPLGLARRSAHDAARGARLDAAAARERRHRGALGGGLERGHDRRDAHRARGQRRAGPRDHGAVHGDAGRLVRLRAAGGDAAQRDRVRERLRHGAEDGQDRGRARPRRGAGRRRLCALLVPRVL